MISSISRASVLVFAGFTLVLAQDRPPAGWRRVSDMQQAPPQQADAFGQPLGQNPVGPPQDDPQFAQQGPPPPPVPGTLTLQPGTFVNVRINGMLSSDRNQAGDSFSAALMQPVVVDGIIVAQRSQTIYGRVADSQKHRSSKPSQLALELTELTLVDGTQLPVRSQLVARQGGTTPTGEQIGTVATTTAIGAMVGAAADWGRGAAIGAGVGAAAGLAGVMLTRNHATVVYPETALTFRIDAPLNISTARAPMAFRYVDGSDYDRQEPPRLEPRHEPRRIYGPSYGPVYSPYYMGYPGYYARPGISFVFGGGYFRGGSWGRGGYRRWR